MRMYRYPILPFPTITCILSYGRRAVSWRGTRGDDWHLGDLSAILGHPGLSRRGSSLLAKRNGAGVHARRRRWEGYGAAKWVLRRCAHCEKRGEGVGSACKPAHQHPVLRAAGRTASKLSTQATGMDDARCTILYTLQECSRVPWLTWLRISRGPNERTACLSISLSVCQSVGTDGLGWKGGLVLDSNQPDTNL